MLSSQRPCGLGGSVVEESNALPDRQPAASLRLLAGIDAAEQAGTFVRDFCSAAGFDVDFLDVAVLVVRELVRKALVHGAEASTVEIQRAGGGLRLTVYDSTPVLPEQRSASQAAPRRDGRALWFELQVLE